MPVGGAGAIAGAGEGRRGDDRRYILPIFIQIFRLSICWCVCVCVCLSSSCSRPWSGILCLFLFMICLFLSAFKPGSNVAGANHPYRRESEAILGKDHPLDPESASTSILTACGVQTRLILRVRDPYFRSIQPCLAACIPSSYSTPCALFVSTAVVAFRSILPIASVPYRHHGIFGETCASDIATTLYMLM